MLAKFGSKSTEALILVLASDRAFKKSKASGRSK